MSSVGTLDYPIPPRGADLPCDDGVPMETERHRNQMWMLIETLKVGWKHRDDFYVAGDMFLYFSETQVRKNDFRGPDLFVVLGTDKRERKSWVVWEEDAKLPSVVVELLSESTEAVDRGKKMRIYAEQLRVPYYYLFDPFTKVFEGYELDLKAGRYARMAPEPDGTIACPVLGLRLGTRRGVYMDTDTEWLRWIEPDGRVLPTRGEEAEALAALERARAESEVARAESEAARAESEARRAVEAESLLNDERRRVDELTARIRELESRSGA